MPPRGIKLTTSATASWTVDSQTRKLDGFKLRVSCDQSAKTAFIKLRIALDPKPVASGPDTTRWLFIAPERIKCITPHDDSNGTVYLHFFLNRPPQLVMPSENDSSLQEFSYNKSWVALKSLATTIRLCISIPSSCISKGSLSLLCADLSEGGFTTSPNDADVASFYNGSGGQIVEGDSLGPETPAKSPSSHPQITPSQSLPATTQELSRKRRRTSLDTSQARPRQKKSSTQESKTQVKAELGEERDLTELRKQLKDELLAELGKQMEEQISVKWKVMQIDLSNQLDRKIELAIDDMKRDNECTILAEVETQVAQDAKRLEDDMENRMDNVDEQIGALIDRVKCRMKQVEALAKQVETLAEQVKTLADSSKGHMEDQIVDTVKRAVVSMRFEWK